MDGWDVLIYAMLGFLGGQCYFFWRRESLSRYDWMKCLFMGAGAGFVAGALAEAPLANYVTAFLGGFAGLTALPAYANLKEEREKGWQEGIDTLNLIFAAADLVEPGEQKEDVDNGAREASGQTET